VDEVLAVGDMAFSKKCYERIFQMRENGTTILFVSHSIGAIWSICTSGIFLDAGVSSGKIGVEDLCRAYDHKSYLMAYNNGGSMSKDYGGKTGGTGDAIIKKVEVCSTTTMSEKSEFDFQEPILLKMHVDINNEINNVLFRYTIDAVHYKYIAVIDSYEANTKIEKVSPGKYVITTMMHNHNLRPGAYTINSAIMQKNVGVHLYFIFEAAKFIVVPPSDRFLYADPNAIVHLDSSFAIERVG
jgi:hypothetical protein